MYMLYSILVSSPVTNCFHIPYPFPTISAIKVLFKTNRTTKTRKHEEDAILQLKIYQLLLVVSEIHTPFHDTDFYDVASLFL